MNPSPRRVAARYARQCDPGTHGWAWVAPNGRVNVLQGRKDHGFHALNYFRQRAPEVVEGFGPLPKWQQEARAIQEMLNQGWVRGVNPFNWETGPLGKVPQAVWSGVLKSLVDCAVANRVDPEAPETVYLTERTGPLSARDTSMSVGDFVRRFGGRQWEDKLFGALLA